MSFRASPAGRLRLAAVLLLCAALQGAVPTPESHFGHPMGADRKLLDWAKVVSYFQALQRSSDRILVQEIGTSVEGRPMIAAFLSSSDNLRNLERYRDVQQRLADPRRTSEVEAEKFIAEGKTVVMITCSIHSTEVASTSTAVEFAHRLLTEDRPKFREILANTIFILVPSLNPDGVDIVTRWYRKTLGTSYEGTSPPELYHKYVGHDNNRDWYIFSQPETRHVISKLHNVWHPQIVYDVHQQSATASRMFVPPWLDPIDPNIDAILAQLCNAVGTGMAADLTAAGRKGISINASYDFWTPARHYQAYHGGLRILSESASARLATPITIRPDDIARTSLGYNPRERSWNHLEPWTGGTWRVGDIVDYQLIAWESCLYQAAVRRADLLRSFWRVHQRAVARKVPYAFVIPAVQYDPGSSKKLADTLQFGMIEIERAAKPFQAGEREYPAGSYVIRMQQPYSAWAKTLLERQDYPDLRLYPGGPPKRPYDVTAQTLPLLMGVEVDTIEKPFAAELAPVKTVAFTPAQRVASGLSARDIGSWREINKQWKNGSTVWRDSVTGDFFTALGANRNLLKQPRIGLYKSYIPSMDEGWTRWLLEQFGFAYTSLFSRDFDDARLKNFDVIIFPDQRAAAIHSGHRPGSMPDEFTGGLGEQGAEALRRYLAAGGRLIFLNHAVEYALDHLNLPVKNAVKGLSDREFYSPGSLLKVKLGAQHPLAYGLPANIAVWSEGSPAFEVSGAARAVAVYPPEKMLASGWLLGEKHLANRAAIADVPSGSGRVILFGMRPQYRAQSYQAFKLFFNALVLP
ncbi:MAG: peptidase M14 [Acidobacteria bacterium]|nr:peptidase M14 [Acidobacteriota bacterium]